MNVFSDIIETTKRLGQISVQPISRGKCKMTAMNKNKTKLIILISISISPLNGFSKNVELDEPREFNWNKENDIECMSSVHSDENIVCHIKNSSTETKTIAVAVDGGTSCSSEIYPEGTTGHFDTYANVNDGAPFGTDTGATMIESFGTNQFLSLSEFYTDRTEFSRRIQTFPSPSDTNLWYAATYSISECPGDFTQTAQCKGVIVPFHTIFITTVTGEVPDNYCQIEAGKMYYINYIHDIDPFDSTPGRCASLDHTVCSMFTSETADEI